MERRPSLERGIIMENENKKTVGEKIKGFFQKDSVKKVIRVGEFVVVAAISYAIGRRANADDTDYIPEAEAVEVSETVE